MTISILARLFDNLSQISGTINFSENVGDLIDNLLHTSFSENGLKLKQVLEEHYKDGIDGFEEVEVNGDRITGIFIDRVSNTLTKKFRFEVTPKATVYSPVSPDDTDDFTELDFASITKDKNCVKGLSCGASCVPMKTGDGKPTKCQRSNSQAAEDLMNDLLTAAKSSQKPKPQPPQVPNASDSKTRTASKEGNLFDDIDNYIPKTSGTQKQTRTPVRSDNQKVTEKLQTPKKTKEQEALQVVDNIISNGLSISRSLGLKPVDPAIDKELADVSKKYKEALGMLKDYQKSKKALPQALIARGKALENKRKELQSKRDEIDNENYKKIVGHLAKNSPITTQDANKFVKSLKVDKSLDEQMQKADTAKALRDVYLLSGGRVKTLENIEKTNDRPFANERRKVVNTGDGKIYKKDSKGNIVGEYNTDHQRRQIFHEVAHHIEYSNPDIKKAAGDFIRMKASSQNPVKLKELTGNQNYRDDEVALPDKFISPYVGKIYQKGTTEVISMGVEHFADAKSLARLRKEDPDHFNFILGVLSQQNK